MGIRYAAAAASLTFTAAADNAVLTANGHISASARTANGNFCRMVEVYWGGEATSTTALAMAVRRHTTIGSTPTDRTPSPLNPASVASTWKWFQTASTQPTVAATATIEHVLSLGGNAFGGIVRWVAAPEEEIWVYSNAANTNELSLSPVTGTAVASGHLILEQL